MAARRRRAGLGASQLTLELEAADAPSEEVAGVALDWRRAYDQVDLQTLPGLLARAGAPAWLACPALAAYGMRRRIRIGKTLGAA